MAQKKQHSRYWMGQDYHIRENESREVNLMRLAGVRRGIAQFVKLLSGKDIPVRFSSGTQSYTDGEKFVVISASANPDHFDSMVGIALHEASHVMHSANLFAIYRWMKVPLLMDILPKETYDNGMKLGLTTDQMDRDLRLLLNFLEDRRIDAITYKSAPGWRPYYEEMYDAHFRNPYIDKLLTNPETSLANYSCQIINLFVASINLDLLPGMRDIFDTANLQHIERYNTDTRSHTGVPVRCATVNDIPNDYPLILQDSMRILDIVYRNATKIDNAKDSKAEDKNKFSAEIKDDEDGFLDELENLDMSDGTADHNGRRIKLTPEQIRKLQQRMIRGTACKNKLSEEDANKMRVLEESGVEIRHADDNLGHNIKANIIVYRVLTDAIMRSGHYPFGTIGAHGYGANRALSSDAVKKGFRMGHILANRIRTMNDESTLRYTRQEHGKIDKRLVHELGFANDLVFYSDHVVRIKPTMIDISIDASSSMSGDKWYSAITVAVALCVAASKIRTLDVRVSLRGTPHHDPVISFIYDSRTDEVTKISKLFPYLYSYGSTPEGLTFEVMQEEFIQEVKSKRKYFINLSDGLPGSTFTVAGTDTVEHYGGGPAVSHTARQVRNMRLAGINVLSYYIGHKQDQYGAGDFTKMYGSDAVFINPESVQDIARTVNKLLLSGDK